MASGDTLLIFTVLNNQPPTGSFAALDTRNAHPVLDYDAGSNEDGIVGGIMPQTYSGVTGTSVFIHYSMSSAESGDIDWDAAWERIGDQQQDVDSDGFAAANSVNNTTVPGTSGLVDIVEIPFADGADMDSVQAGDSFRLKITRDAASDTAAGDAELHKVEIREN